MGEKKGMSRRAVTVMQSFGAPRPTSNPYVHLLDRALARTDGIDHLRFDRRRALFGRYDALHFHWPETLFGGGNRIKAAARTLYATALVARLSLGRIAVIRTVHNLELPRDVTAWQRRLLVRIDRVADHRIVLNENTPVPPGAASTLVPHGHFGEWFRDAPAPAPQPRTLGFVGLVRRYKGVEELLAAFAETAPTHPDWSLRVSGNPTSGALGEEVRGRAATDRRVSTDLRFLSEDDFASAVRSCSAVVLPYRHMHNSGAVLAALSLGRPVLVPDNAVNRSLRDEVGHAWVHLYHEDISADALRALMAAVGDGPPAGSPTLDARDWSAAGLRHRTAYRLAVRARRSRGRG
ncbi:glycosyltransferase [Microbacterium sp. NPDC078428]|uniref:glycosyltransferase n=1 Tax=Microbacterium sp. NPDC078428 TaxID=3364190 RepID=UPI0037C5DE7A